MTMQHQEDADFPSSAMAKTVSVSDIVNVTSDIDSISSVSAAENSELKDTLSGDLSEEANTQNVVTVSSNLLTGAVDSSKAILNISSSKATQALGISDAVQSDSALLGAALPQESVAVTQDLLTQVPVKLNVAQAVEDMLPQESVHSCPSNQSTKEVSVVIHTSKVQGKSAPFSKDEVPDRVALNTDEGSAWNTDIADSTEKVERGDNLESVDLTSRVEGGLAVNSIAATAEDSGVASANGVVDKIASQENMNRDGKVYSAVNGGANDTMYMGDGQVVNKAGTESLPVDDTNLHLANAAASVPSFSSITSANHASEIAPFPIYSQPYTQPQELNTVIEETDSFGVSKHVVNDNSKCGHMPCFFIFDYAADRFLLDAGSCRLLGLTYTGEWIPSQFIEKQMTIIEDEQYFNVLFTQDYGDLLLQTVRVNHGEHEGDLIYMSGSVLQRDDTGIALVVAGYLSRIQVNFVEYLSRIKNNSSAFDFDVVTGEIHYGPAYKDLLGYKDSKDIPSYLNSFEKTLIHPDDLQIFKRINDIIENPQGGYYYEAIFRLQHKSGFYLWCISRGLIVERDGNGRATRIIGTTTNIDILRSNFERLKRSIYQDPLTGLHNRLYLNTRYKYFTMEESQPLSLVYADISGLKLINDYLGHSNGDTLVKLAAQILQNDIYLDHEVVRLSGDEFLLIFTACPAVDCRLFINKFTVELNERNKYQEFPVPIFFGFGIATLYEIGHDDTFLRCEARADARLQEYKKAHHDYIYSALRAYLETTLGQNIDLTDNRRLEYLEHNSQQAQKSQQEKQSQQGVKHQSNQRDQQSLENLQNQQWQHVVESQQKQSEGLSEQKQAEQNPTICDESLIVKLPSAQAQNELVSQITQSSKVRGNARLIGTTTGFADTNSDLTRTNTNLKGTADIKGHSRSLAPVKSGIQVQAATQAVSSAALSGSSALSGSQVSVENANSFIRTTDVDSNTINVEHDATSLESNATNVDVESNELYGLATNSVLNIEPDTEVSTALNTPLSDESKGEDSVSRYMSYLDECLSRLQSGYEGAHYSGDVPRKPVYHFMHRPMDYPSTAQSSVLQEGYNSGQRVATPYATSQNVSTQSFVEPRVSVKDETNSLILNHADVINTNANTYERLLAASNLSNDTSELRSSVGQTEAPKSVATPSNITLDSLAVTPNNLPATPQHTAARPNNLASSSELNNSSASSNDLIKSQNESVAEAVNSVPIDVLTEYAAEADYLASCNDLYVAQSRQGVNASDESNSPQSSEFNAELSHRALSVDTRVQTHEPHMELGNTVYSVADGQDISNTVRTSSAIYNSSAAKPLAICDSNANCALPESQRLGNSNNLGHIVSAQGNLDSALQSANSSSLNTKEGAEQEQLTIAGQNTEGAIKQNIPTEQVDSLQVSESLVSAEDGMDNQSYVDALSHPHHDVYDGSHLSHILQMLQHGETLSPDEDIPVKSSDFSNNQKPHWAKSWLDLINDGHEDLQVPEMSVSELKPEVIAAAEHAVFLEDEYARRAIDNLPEDLTPNTTIRPIDKDEEHNAQVSLNQCSLANGQDNELYTEKYECSARNDCFENNDGFEIRESCENNERSEVVNGIGQIDFNTSSASDEQIHIIDGAQLVNTIEREQQTNTTDVANKVNITERAQHTGTTEVIGGTESIESFSKGADSARVAKEVGSVSVASESAYKLDESIVKSNLSTYIDHKVAKLKVDSEDRQYQSKVKSQYVEGQDLSVSASKSASVVNIDPADINVTLAGNRDKSVPSTASDLYMQQDNVLVDEIKTSNTQSEKQGGLKAHYAVEVGDAHHQTTSALVIINQHNVERELSQQVSDSMETDLTSSGAALIKEHQETFSASEDARLNLRQHAYIGQVNTTICSDEAQPAASSLETEIIATGRTRAQAYAGYGMCGALCLAEGVYASLDSSLERRAETANVIAYENKALDQEQLESISAAYSPNGASDVQEQGLNESLDTSSRVDASQLVLGYWYYRGKDQSFLLDKKCADYYGLPYSNEWIHEDVMLQCIESLDKERYYKVMHSLDMGSIIFENIMLKNPRWKNKHFVIDGSVLSRFSDSSVRYAVGYLTQVESSFSELIAHEIAGDGFFTWDQESGCLHFSSSTPHVQGRGPNEFNCSFYEWLRDMVHPDDIEILDVERNIFVSANYGDNFEFCIRLRQLKGNYIWSIARGIVLKRNEIGQATSIIGTLSNINLIRDNFENIKQLLYTDTLTGLHNRSYFQHHMTLWQDEMLQPVSVIYADITGLKITNDVLGHADGDALIMAVTDALTMVLDSSCDIMRLSGDEFLVVMPHCDKELSLQRIDELQDYLKERNKQPGVMPVFIGFGRATMGEVPQDTLHACIERADVRMQKVKEEKRSENYKALQKYLEMRKGRPVSMRDGRRLEYYSDEERKQASIRNAGGKSAAITKTPY